MGNHYNRSNNFLESATVKTNGSLHMTDSEPLKCVSCFRIVRVNMKECPFCGERDPLLRKCDSNICTKTATCQVRFNLICADRTSVTTYPSIFVCDDCKIHRVDAYMTDQFWNKSMREMKNVDAPKPLRELTTIGFDPIKINTKSN